MSAVKIKTEIGRRRREENSAVMVAVLEVRWDRLQPYRFNAYPGLQTWAAWGCDQ